jgi:subtilisin
MKRRFRFSFLLTLTCILAILGTSSIQAAPSVDSYIIVFKDTVDVHAAVPGLEKAFGLQSGFVYQHALKGMSAVVPAGRLAALQRDPRVAYVVEDMERSITAQTVPTGIQRIFADDNSNIGINGSDDWRVDVDVAVIDTGVDYEHPDLNVVGGVNCTGKIFTATCVPGGDDDHYHGTHVAGTIGAIDNGTGVVGVAPGARIHPVKVLNSRGSGYTSWIVAGIDWVAANAGTIEVANMSLGGSGYNQAEYDAIQGAVNNGVAFAVSAGNSDADANNYSPAAFDNVLTVSALADFDGAPGGLGSPTCRTDRDDTLADFSNWGSAVDIAAPGVCILSTYPLEQGEYGTISGTSMASPHVAGALALLASRNNPGNDVDVYKMYDQVIQAGNYNWTDDSGDGIKERLLDVSNTTLFNPVLVAGSGGGGETNQPPTANFTYTTLDLTAAFTDTSSDSDGSITSWNWTFGDGGTSTVQNPSHTYGAAGTYEVSLTVSDNESATGTISQNVTVSSSVSGINLSVSAYKVKGQKYADLTWSGATSTNVDVYRDGKFVVTTNNGAYTDGPLGVGGGSATYKVCEEKSTTTCSNEVTVTW